MRVESCVFYPLWGEGRVRIKYISTFPGPLISSQDKSTIKTMGGTRVKLYISSLTLTDKSPRKKQSIECIADTGVTFTTIPTSLLKKAGVVKKGELSLRLADGRIIHRAYGEARLELDGTSVPAMVVFGKKSDPPLLGTTVLEMAGFIVDPIEKKIHKKEYFQQY